MQRWLTGSLAALVLFGLGCSKESTEPGPPPNYFPLKVGNWWVYTGIELDTAGAEVPGTEWRDSTVVVGEVTVQGRKGYVMVTYRSGSREGVDTTIVATDGGRLYIYLEGHSEEIPGPTGWVKFADVAAGSWRLLDTTVTDAPVEENLTVTGTLSWGGERGGAQVVTVKGRQVTAQEFRVRIQFEGRLRSRGVEIGTMSFTMVQHLWAAEGIGIVRWQTDPSEMVIRSSLLPGGQMTQKEEGERTMLVDYFVQ